MTETTEWLTLTEVAEQLSISPRTVRRWIHQGKLRAELRPGPYGPQYFVAADQLAAAHEIHAVIQVNRPVELEDFARALASYLSERDGTLNAQLEAVGGQLQEALRRHDDQAERSRAKLEQLEHDLAAVRHAVEELGAWLKAARTVLGEGDRWQDTPTTAGGSGRRLDGGAEGTG
jgi:excisionase family DNA binding protein